MLHLVKMAVGIETVHHLQAVQKKRLKGNLDAGLGPLVMGLLHDATDGWLAPLAFLFAALIAQTVAGLAIARPRYIEDEPA